MRRVYYSVIVGGFALGALVTFLSSTRARAREVFALGSDGFERTSAVNAALVRALASDIAAGADPADLEAACLRAVERERAAFVALPHLALPWWSTVLFETEAQRRFRFLADSELTAVQAAAAAVAELARLPQEEWSPAVERLRAATEQFVDAHERMFKT